MPHFAISHQEIQVAQNLIQTAFQEDLADSEDITTKALVPESARGTIRVIARKPGVLCGNSIAALVFDHFDPTVTYLPHLSDGDTLQAGSLIAEISGPMRSLLTAERTALNFLTMLSGIATLTHAFVSALGAARAQVLDTRKTLPGLRNLQKYAVRCGGGTNHRMGLFDAVLIKDNHLAWWKGENRGTLVAAVARIRECVKPGTIVEIEVDSLKQLTEVLPALPEIVLLDNLPEDQLRQAVHLRNLHAPTVLLEASGGITLQSMPAIAATGVDRISVGALTHSAVALDIGFDWSAEISE